MEIQETERSAGAADPGALPFLVKRALCLSMRVRLVARATPTNADAEIRRAIALRRAGERARPSFVYACAEGDADDLLHLVRLEEECEESLGSRHVLTERVAELALEARIARSIGTSEMRELAKQRFRSTKEEDERALRWASYSIDPEDGARRVLSDDEREETSLLSLARRAVGEKKLPVRVIVKENMASLAATGDGVLLVAAGRSLTAREAARTVLHEIEGHVIPSLERAAGTVIARLRRAGDSDAEEGRALAIERQYGLLDPSRRKELGMRHVAAAMAHEGAELDDIADKLESLCADPVHAVRLAARAARGGGLGRERVYLPAFWRIAR